MTDTNLRRAYLGRKVRPYGLAVSLAMLVIALWILLFADDEGVVLDATPVGYAAGALALCAALLLWGGWWVRSDRLMRAGLLVSAGVFAGRAAFLFLDAGSHAVSAWLSICWAVASGGAYLLERDGKGAG